jgi:hypothetical protein
MFKGSGFRVARSWLLVAGSVDVGRSMLDVGCSFLREFLPDLTSLLVSQMPRSCGNLKLGTNIPNFKIHVIQSLNS